MDFCEAKLSKFCELCQKLYHLLSTSLHISDMLVPFSSQGFNIGDSAPFSMLIYKDFTFEFTFGPSNPSLCAFRCKLRDGQDGHPKGHCWMFDVDDSGVGVDGTSWRGVLVLQRIQESIDGKYKGDRLVGDLQLESSEGQEQNFKIILDENE